MERREFIKLEEAAAFLGYKVSTLRKLCCQKKLPYYKFGKIFFDKKELEELIERKRVPSAEEVSIAATNN